MKTTNKSPYKLFVIAAGLLIAGPVVLGLVLKLALAVTSLEFLAYAILYVVMFAPWIMLTGAVLLLAGGFVRGLDTLRNIARARLENKQFRLLPGVACVGLVLFLAYIPAGPDDCSRAFTDKEYEACLEAMFADMTIEQVRSWMAGKGYSLSNTYIATEAYMMEGPNDLRFTAIRDYGHWRSVPYGTNFNRLFARLGIAPEHFELNVYGKKDDDRIADVEVWWAFEFL